MLAAAAVVCVSLLVILLITAVVVRVRRGRVRRVLDETPQDRYRREVLSIRHSVDVRTRPRGWRRRPNRATDSAWAAGMTSHGAVVSAWAAGSDGGSDGGGGDG